MTRITPTQWLRHSVIALLSAATCLTAQAVKPQLITRAESPAMDHWVDSVFNSLSHRDRIAQLMMPVISPGDTIHADGNLYDYVNKNHVGGLLVSKGTAQQYATLVSTAQHRSKTPLFIAIDGEWGVAMRVTDAIEYPKNGILGKIENNDLLYEYGLEVARQCRILGVNIDFAPVLDVNTNSQNTVIGLRSYGNDAMNVARKGIFFSSGLEDGGVLSVAKHYPGHGSPAEDSHKTLPTVNKSLADIYKCDILPFRFYTMAQLGGMLTAHLNVPAMGTNGAPASLSHSVVTESLQNQLKFEGLIFTDALTMAGASTDGSVCVAALKAGNDILLVPGDIAKELTAIENAIKSGELDDSSVMAHVKKALRYKYALIINRRLKTNSNNIAEQLNSPSAKSIKKRLIEATQKTITN